MEAEGAEPAKKFAGFSRFQSLPRHWTAAVKSPFTFRGPTGGLPLAKALGTKDLVDYVAKKTGMSAKQTRAGIKTTFEGIATLLKKADRVSVTGVGTFQKTVKPAQKGGQKAKNPFTGEEYVTKPKPAQTKVKFRAGKSFKMAVGGK
jgi:nucleoid DNA-binding protein